MKQKKRNGEEVYDGGCLTWLLGEGPQAFIRRHVIGCCAVSKPWLAHSPQIVSTLPNTNFSAIWQSNLVYQLCIVEVVMEILVSLTENSAMDSTQNTSNNAVD